MNVQIETQLAARICQGDLIRNVAFIEDILEDGENIEVQRILFPLVVVLTQDCDLEQDDPTRKRKEGQSANQHAMILSVLVAPAYNAAHFELGDHLSELKLTMRSFPTAKGRQSTDQRNLRQNKNPRYHYLEFSPESNIADSVIDFKHYFSVNVPYLKRIKQGANFVGKLGTLYREDVSQRFASFLARIGLPNQSPVATDTY